MLKKSSRVQRKLHALRTSRRRGKHTASGGSPSSTAITITTAQRHKPPFNANAATAIVVACTAAAIGFDVCAQKTRDEAITVAAARESASLRCVAEEIIAVVAAHGVDARARKRTCDRLRWEWLASTGMVLDGRPETRLLSECGRILEALPAIDLGSSGRDDDVERDVTARLRVAAMTAGALVMAIVDPHAQLAFALA
jgi:hypothetical protein